MPAGGGGGGSPGPDCFGPRMIAAATSCGRFMGRITLGSPHTAAAGGKREATLAAHMSTASTRSLPSTNATTFHCHNAAGPTDTSHTSTFSRRSCEGTQLNAPAPCVTDKALEACWRILEWRWHHPVRERTIRSTHDRLWSRYMSLSLVSVSGQSDCTACLPAAGPSRRTRTISARQTLVVLTTPVPLLGMEPKPPLVADGCSGPGSGPH